jgi:hypothetical protein
VELELDPGETVSEHAAVTNFSDTDISFGLTAADGYFTSTGRFNMLPPGEPSTGSGTWLSLPDSVRVAPGETAIVPFEISAPDDAAPGDHLAGIAASVETSPSEELTLNSRVGFRVVTRVSGDLAPALRVDTAGDYAQEFNPFEPGTLISTVDIANTGNVTLSVTGAVRAACPLGMLTSDISLGEVDDLAPGETRTVEIEWPRAWPCVVYTLTPLLTATDAPAPIQQTATPSMVAAIPISQITALVLGTVLLWTLHVQRRSFQSEQPRFASTRR